MQILLFFLLSFLLKHYKSCVQSVWIVWLNWFYFQLIYQNNNSIRVICIYTFCYKIYLPIHMHKKEKKILKGFPRLSIHWSFLFIFLFFLFFSLHIRLDFIFSGEKSIKYILLWFNSQFSSRYQFFYFKTDMKEEKKEKNYFTVNVHVALFFLPLELKERARLNHNLSIKSLIDFHKACI